MHLFSNMRHLGRIGLFVRVVKTFLVNLKRHRRDLFDALPKEMAEKYLRKSGESVFSMVKPSESARTLSMLGDDLFFLAQRFRAEEAVSGMSSFRQLCRCLAEQCAVEENGATGEQKVRVKPNKEVPSDSLQNPSDPDATYCGHKGQGYQAQIMETYSPAPSEDSEGSREEREPVLRLITHVAVEPAHVSDAHAVIPAIDDTKRRGLAPTEVLADSLYGSEKNVEDAATMGTEVVAPVPGGGTESRSAFLSNFTFSPEGGIVQCPAGHTPIEDTVHRKHREVVFATGDCFGCPRKGSCLIKSVRQGYGFSYDRKQVKMAQRRAREKTASFKERYRYRSGVESTMSELDRLTGVKHLRVRGMKAVRFAVTLKVLGVNLFRSAAVYCKGSDGKPTGKTPSGAPRAGIAPHYGEWCRLVHRLVDHVAPCPGNWFFPVLKAA